MSKSRYLTYFLSQILILQWESLNLFPIHCQEFSVPLLTIVTKTYNRSLAFVPSVFPNFLCPLSPTHQCPNPDNHHPLSAFIHPTVSTFTSETPWHSIPGLLHLTSSSSDPFLSQSTWFPCLFEVLNNIPLCVVLYHIFFLHLSNVGYFDFISWLFWTTLSWKQMYFFDLI